MILRNADRHGGASRLSAESRYDGNFFRNSPAINKKIKWRFFLDFGREWWHF
jgi:hypothetical protein